MAGLAHESARAWNHRECAVYKNRDEYLDSVYSADMAMWSEISDRLSSAGKALHKLTNMKIWEDSAISRKTNVTLYKVIVQSALLYGCETWGITVQETQRLEVFQMRCLRLLRKGLGHNFAGQDIQCECQAEM